MSAYEVLQVVAVVLAITVFVLTRAADRYPHVRWLRKVRETFPRIPEERRRKFQRHSTVLIGLQLILFGVVLPIGFVVLKAMTFSNFSTTEFVLVGALSLLCIGLGITAVWQSRR